MPRPRIFKTTVFEDTGKSLLNFVVGNNGVKIVQADVTTVKVSTFDSIDLGTALVNASSLTVSTVVFDTLQVDNLWVDEDTGLRLEGGYNFKQDTPASYYPTGGRTIVVEYTFDMASGENMAIVWHVVVKPLATS